MMTDTRDPLLQSLFDEAKQDFEGKAITANVMAQTRNRLVTKAAIAATTTLAVLLVSWYVFALPLLDFAILVSQFFTNPLFELGEGWLALFLMPVNNFASLSVLLVKAGLVAWKKLTGTSLVR